MQSCSTVQLPEHEHGSGRVIWDDGLANTAVSESGKDTVCITLYR
jgi:hypothetical protein